MSEEHMTMRCMEVWGGNAAVASGVAMAGLDAWIYCRPYQGAQDAAAEAGGDLYYVSSCATGRIARLLLADVSGHGPGVSQIAINLRRLMRKYVNYLDPCRFVGEVNRSFSKLSENGCFATAIITTFFAPTNRLTLCNAGHPPPLLYRPGFGWRYVEQERDDSDKPVDLPLGIEDTSSYRPMEVRMKAGDIVLCYTDGVPESRGVDGDLLGAQGLLEVVRTLDATNPSQLVPTLLERIAALHEGNLTQDDVTVLMYKCTGEGVATPIVQRILSPLRVVWGVIRSMFPGGGPAPWPDHHPANMGGAVISPLNKLWE